MQKNKKECGYCRKSTIQNRVVKKVEINYNIISYTCTECKKITIDVETKNERKLMSDEPPSTDGVLCA